MARKNNKGGRHRSTAELAAIRRYYVQKRTPSWMAKARAALQNPPKSPVPLIPVIVRDHRDSNGGHPHVMMEKIDNKEVSVGLTKDQFKGKNHTNYSCLENPLGGVEQSYMHRQGTVDDSITYSEESVTGRMHPIDYDKAKIYAQRAKEKYLEKEKQENKKNNLKKVTAVPNTTLSIISPLPY